MSNILWKSFNLCFSKFKCLPTITFSPPLTNEEEEEEGKDCYENDEKFPVPTTNTSPIITNNFNSLYDLNLTDNSTFKSLTFCSSTTTTTTATAAAVDDLFSSSDDSDTDSIIPLFTSAAFASHRFFFSSPGSSNSIFEPRQHRQNSGTTVTGCVAVQTYSPDPYADFRKSMQEMIEARELTDIQSNCEFLRQLLACYLTLNPKQTHKFIMDAFADVIVSLVSPPDGSCQKTHHHQRCATLPGPL